MSDRIHARKIVGYEGEIPELATELGQLTYDQVSNFLGALAAELSRQAEGDHGRGRKQLAMELEDAATSTLAAQASIDRAWGICRPHMKPEELGEDKEE